MPGAFRPALLPFWEVMGERIMYRGCSESISRWGTNHVPSLGTGTTLHCKVYVSLPLPHHRKNPDTEPRTNAQYPSSPWPNHNDCPSTSLFQAPAKAPSVTMRGGCPCCPVWEKEPSLGTGGPKKEVSEPQACKPLSSPPIALGVQGLPYRAQQVRNSPLND